MVIENATYYHPKQIKTTAMYYIYPKYNTEIKLSSLIFVIFGIIKWHLLYMSGFAVKLNNS
jgi:hypothetical protein